MRYTNPATQKASQLVNLVCGVIFFWFCFLYIIHFQDGLLSFAQHFYSGGRTEYSPSTSAFLCAALLTSIGTVLSYFLIIPLHFRALAWFPSCLLLGLLTDVNIPEVFPNHSGGHWWSFLLWGIIYIGSLFAAYQFRDIKDMGGSKLSFVCSNLAQMVCFLFLAACLSNTDDYQHRLLSLEQKIIEGDDEEVLTMLRNNDRPKGNLLPIEAYVMSRNGLMVDSIFSSGHFTSSNQLLPSADDTLRAVALPKRLHEYLGVKLKNNSHANAIQFLRNATNDSLCQRPVEEYLLCGYLLDRKLRNFAGYLSCASSINEQLPMRYREALILYNHIEYRPSVSYTDDSLSYCFDEFLLSRNTISESDTILTVDSIQRIKTKYAKTYWNYYYR